MSTAIRETCCCGAVIELDDLLTFTERDRSLGAFHERHATCAPRAILPHDPQPKPGPIPWWWGPVCDTATVAPRDEQEGQDG